MKVPGAKIHISSSFNKFSFRIFVVLDFEVVDLGDLNGLKNGLLKYFEMASNHSAYNRIVVY